MEEKNSAEVVMRGRTEGKTDGLRAVGKQRGKKAAADAARLLV